MQFIPRPPLLSRHHLAGICSAALPGLLLMSLSAAEAAEASATPIPASGHQSAPVYLAQNAPGSSQQAASRPQEQPPQKKPEVQTLPDIGGVLTPRGKLKIEPEFQYNHSSVNRFTFRGVEFLSSLGIGLLEAENIDRNALIAALTFRLGLTNRLELETKVPYIYRKDRADVTIPQFEGVTQEQGLDTGGLGDVELALHYQMNRGLDGWPFFVANLRYKSTTGEGPFDVERDENGIEQELAMGSGFHSLEPGVTVLYLTDPAVFYSNLSYLFNLEDNVDKVIGASGSGGDSRVRVGKVDPGDAVRISFGMAYSINERASFSLGFKNDFIQKTRSEFIDIDTGETTTASTSTLNIGSLLLGYALQISPRTAANVNLEFGVTADAPDVLLTVRLPMQFELY